MGAESGSSTAGCGLGLRRALLLAAGCVVLACQSGTQSSEVDVSAEISAGELALARGNLDDAKLHFEGALQARSGSQRAWIGLARTHVAGGDVDAALLLFDKVDPARIRDAGLGTFWDYCTALIGAAERRLAEDRSRAALELAQRGEADGCGASRAHELSLRSRLGMAEEARRSGDVEGALDLYLGILGPRAMAVGFEASPELRGPALGPEAPNLEGESRLRAYLGAAALLLESGRREEALSLLYGGLMRFPDNTEMVELMVEGLAQPSGTQPKERR